MSRRLLKHSNEQAGESIMNDNTTTIDKEARKDPFEGMQTPPLEVHDLTVAYYRRPVLWDIDFAVPEGRLVGIVGPNGSGKTTLIKATLGMVPLASGWVQCYGKSANEQRKLIVRSRVAIKGSFLEGLLRKVRLACDVLLREY